jgi:gliding motility-associated-like protein
MALKKVILFILLITIVILINKRNAQGQSSPSITYSTPQVYIAGSAITPLSPNNTGGTVYPANYNTPTTFVSYVTPFSIAIDGADNVYTTNNTTGDLTKYNSSGTVLFTIKTGVNQASEVAVDGLGNIYVSQFTASSILKYSSTGTLLAIITGVRDPYGITVDASNNVYIADFFAGNILKINAGTTTAAVFLTGFVKPYGLIIDASGNLFVGEQGPGDIVKVAAGALTRTSFATRFNGPRHLNMDPFGNIYVADFGNNAIKRISPSGNITTVLSGLASPRQAAFDSSGNLFIADFGANTLLKSMATTYSINAPLPAGLNFDTSTGQITGTPLAPLPTTTYTITAYNTVGISSAQLALNIGSNAGNQQVPVVTTLPATSITNSSAILNGVAKYSGSTNLVSFVYGTDPSLAVGTTTTAPVISNSSAAASVNSIFALTGLKPVTTYYYRVTATNPTGATTGSIASFKTVPWSNANLSDIAVTNDSLALVIISTGSTNYSANLSANTAKVMIMPAALDPNATMTVNGVPVAIGTSSAYIHLNAGINLITIVITAQDGVTKKTYLLTLNRALPPLLGFAYAMEATMYTPGFSTTPAISKPNKNGPNATLGTNKIINTLENAPEPGAPAADKIVVHKAVSPNGDGINDYLLIEGIEDCPDNRVIIFNRNGLTIYNVSGYNNSSKVFDGHSSIDGRLQQPGTYFYQVECNMNGKKIIKTGFITLKFS